jgi:Brp/Blh family beta-carotene 15,15'-monooxygenase
MHVAAIALGGLVIWVPALTRPSEMQSLLTLILPSSDGGEAGQIVWITRNLAWVLCPIACLMGLRQLMVQGRDLSAWVPLATAGIAASAPILVSFTAYFCLWHSILGLARLRSEEGLTGRQFIAATTPLSAMAVAGVVALGWLFQKSFGGATIDSIPASLQMLFIGLSAIAVPHLLLHEWADSTRVKTQRAEVPC